MPEAIPALVVRRVSKSVVGPQVDDAAPLRDELRDQRRGGAMRQGQEYGVDVRHVGVYVEVRAGQLGMRDGHRLMVTVPTLEARDVHVRVPLQEADELPADIAGGADDAHSDGRPSAHGGSADVAATVICHGR
jgi:hypothetical protein